MPARFFPLTAALVVVVAACSGGAAPPAASGSVGTPATSPTASTSIDCPAAPAPPAQVPGWTSAATEPSVFPVIVNSSGSLTCGQNRLLFSFLDGDNRPVGKPDRSAAVALYNLGHDPAAAVQTIEGTFVWGIEDAVGFYIAQVTFPEAGVQ